MRFKETFWKYLGVILLGMLVYEFIDWQQESNQWLSTVVALVVTAKTCFFFWFSFRKVLEVSSKDLPYHQFLLFMALNVALIILSFGFDNFCVYKANPTSFTGIKHGYSEIELFFEFFYYSILAFTNFGFGDIIAASALSKATLSAELLLSFAYIIFFLSDFISLKESISSTKNKDKEN
jgi:hypothetical protein